jgi:DNA polymerase-3 subunit epsilon
MLLIFDTETTGLWNKKLPCGHDDQPKIVQLAALMVEPETRREIMRIALVLQCSVPIPEASTKVHGTTTEFSKRYGVNPQAALDVFCDMADAADTFVAHNIEFDVNVINNAARLMSGNPILNVFEDKPQFCTMKAATPVCRFPSKNGGGGFGWPKLELAVPKLLGRAPSDAHQAIGDAIDCRDLFFHLQDLVARRPSVGAAA